MAKSRSGSADKNCSDAGSKQESLSDVEENNAKSDTDSSDSSKEEPPADKANLPEANNDSKKIEVEDKKIRSKSRSRSRSHHRRHHHKSHRHSRRHRSRSRSNDKHHKSRHRRRKLSRNTDKHKHKRRRSSSPRQTRRKSRSGSRPRRRSRDRHHGHRSRSRSDSFRRGSRRKLTFKDEMREKLLAADIALASNIAESAKSEAAQGKIAAAQAAAKAAATGNNLMDAIEKARIVHEQQLKDMQEKAEAMTGVSIPKFYNPIAVNPLKYAEQQSKRKLLWSKKEDDKPDMQKNVNLWNSTSLTAARGDDQAANKFRKLMGIHGEVDADHLNAQDLVDQKPIVDQKELFNKLDQQYEAARTHTHTQRGVGLGYSQHAYIDPNNYSATKQDNCGT